MRNTVLFFSYSFVRTGRGSYYSALFLGLFRNIDSSVKASGAVLARFTGHGGLIRLSLLIAASAVSSAAAVIVIAALVEAALAGCVG